jgi:hypothetical protein
MVLANTKLAKWLHMACADLTWRSASHPTTLLLLLLLLPLSLDTACVSMASRLSCCAELLRASATLSLNKCCRQLPEAKGRKKAKKMAVQLPVQPTQGCCWCCN